MHSIAPGYLKLLETGELQARVVEAYEKLKLCTICARNCRVDRTGGHLGVCRTGELAKVSSYGPHMGEENPLRGWRGSGTIFFAGCNMNCQYCQNYDISQLGHGTETDPKIIATMMLELQAVGCHNINFVSPSHVVPQILASVLIAAQAGLELPLVYNTGGYDSYESLALLDGVIDIYMPDMKYSSTQIGLRYSKIRNYPQINQITVKEMHRQVGDLVLDENGVAIRGLLVRHLVLPNNLSGTEQIVSFLADEISTNTYLNLMDQYRPTYKADRYPKLNRRITSDEYRKAVDLAHEAGLFRLDHRIS